MLPPLFVHFALVFPDRPEQLGAQRRRPPDAAAALSAGRAPRRRGGGAGPARRIARAGAVGRSPTLIERGELVYLAISLIGGLAIMIRALRRGCSVMARRQLRWIVWGTALGAVPVRVRLRAALHPRLHPLEPVRVHRGAPRPGAAGVRVRDHPLPADGRRGDHQAGAGIRRGVGGDRGDLRHPPRACRTVLPARRGSTQPDHRAAGDDRRGAAVQPGQERDSERARSRLLPRPLRLSPGAGRLRARPEQRSRPAAAQRAAGAARHRDAGRRSHGTDARAGGGRPRRQLRHHRAERLRRPTRPGSAPTPTSPAASPPAIR